MNDRRFFFGLTTTVLWLGTMAWVVAHDPAAARAMKPNEWGDFFAGFSAPLAFLWLVLGYMQQGQELQLSTRALLLQAEELKNSVQQQRDLVEVTRLQVENDRESLQLERRARQEAAQPYFVVTNQGGSFSGAGPANYSIAIANAGNTATSVVGVLDVPGKAARTILNVAMFARSTQASFNIDLPEPFPDAAGSFSLQYVDADGRPGAVRFTIARQHPTEQSMLEFHATAG